MRTPEELAEALLTNCPATWRDGRGGGRFYRIAPSDIAAAIRTAQAEARAAALEEAAEIAGRDVDWTAFGKADLPQWDGGPDGVRDYRIGINAGRNIAAAIRALQEPSCPSPAEEERTG